MFAQLGNHIFKGLKSPVSFNEADAVNYGQIPRVNNKAAIQPTGAELRGITISMQYSSDWCEPMTEIEALKKSMNGFEILPFITGEGRIIGKFVITNIDTMTLRTAPNGRVEIAMVNIALLESTGGEEPKPIGQALSSQKPITVSPATPVIGETSAPAIAKDIATAKNKVNAIKQTVTKVKKNTTSLKRGVRDVRQLATDAQKAYSSAKNKVVVTKKIIKRASELPTSLDEAIKYAENLTKLDDVVDIKVLEMDTAKLSESAEKVNKNAAPVIGFGATKEGGN